MRLVIFFLSVFCASTVYAEYPTNNIFCFDVSSTISSEKGPSGLQSLYRILQNEVENEMQVYNNDELTWHLKGGCTIDVGSRVPIYDQEQACVAGVFQCERVGFRGWVQTRKWVGELYLAGFKGGMAHAWTLGRLYRREDFHLPKVCESRVRELGGVQIYGYQANNANWQDRKLNSICADELRYNFDTHRQSNDSRAHDRREPYPRHRGNVRHGEINEKFSPEERRNLEIILRNQQLRRQGQ